MTTVKLFSPVDWSDVPEKQYQIKVASTGLTGKDLKEAQENVDPKLLEWLSKLSLHPDCFYVHKTAMGGSHRYGPNRWGDGFREEVLARDCKTFEQNAKAYRNHKSDGDFYGRPKVAQFNDKTGWVELITEYYGTDKVASAEGGKVADEEIESLQKHGHIPVSMGSLVPGDRCVICAHWAPKPKDRCTSKEAGGDCELFGCKTGMLKVSDDGRINYVDNPVNVFYDISKVRTGADPIANGILLPIGDFASKLSAIELYAEELVSQIPDEQSLNRLEKTALDLSYYLADMEPKTAEFEIEELDAGFASHKTASVPGLISSNPERFRDAVTVLVRRREFPDFENFAKSAGLSDTQVDQAAGFVPNLFSRLAREHQLIPVIKRASLFEYNDKNLDNFALSTLADIDSKSVTRRAMLANAQQRRPERRKLAAMDARVPNIVLDYAAAKLAFFVARKTVDPYVLFGVTRRDCFKGN